MNILVNLTGIGLIGFVYWFFLMRQEVAVTAEKEILITVEGGYKPEVITVKRGQEVKLKFYRKDPSSCLEEVVLSDFKIRQVLALNKITQITLKPEKAGEFRFSCGMNMFHGKLKVV